ncbi:MAG: TetR family transcriptional regulator C-terminal domain-containing protein [Gammaproteobacteria bacterium]|nr:TetR family transcriptional regulator C-terminal domain-containing protein [Gammaproteobacteria bacterium]
MSSVALRKQHIEKVKADIIEAAIEEFGEHGYYGARVQAIADRAGVPKANLLYHFGDKHSLYLNILQATLRRWNSALDTLSEHDDPKKALSGYVALKLQLVFEQPVATRLFAMEVLRGAPSIQGYLKMELKPWLRERVAVLHRWIELGKIQPIDPQVLIFMIWASTQHYAEYVSQIEALTETSPELDEITEALTCLVLNAVGLYGTK